MRVVLPGEPRSLNPIFSDFVTWAFNANFLYNDPLWVRNERGDLVPRLALRVPTVANHDIAPDGRSITVHLRRGVTWQDGEPFTSADVRFSWEAVMDPRNNFGSLEGFDRVTRIDTPDPYTAVAHLRDRYANAVPVAFPQLPIIPAHLLRNVSLPTASFNALPIGTGPYKVVSWKRGESIDLVANDSYYLGKPKIRKLRVLFIPHFGTAAVMLKTGEADLAELDRDAYRQISGASNVTFSIAPQRFVSMFFLNVTRPNLEDVRVRRALAHAIDRAKIIQALSVGQAVDTLANGYPGPGSLGFAPGLAPIPYDPHKAAELLDAAGWHLGRDGIRVKNGTRLTLQFATAAGAASANTVNVLAQAMLHDVGVEATVKTYSSQMIFAPASSHGVLASGTFDIFYATYGNGTDGDSSWLLTCARVEPKGYNESRFCNRDLDALEANGLGTYDRAARQRYYEQISRLLATEVPMIFISWPKIVHGMNPRLKGFVFSGNLATWNAYQWSL